MECKELLQKDISMKSYPVMVKNATGDFETAVLVACTIWLRVDIYGTW